MDITRALQNVFKAFIFILSFSFAHGFNYEFVTCGSSVKLLNTYHGVRLHSHDVKYGSGSGQQSVTAVDSSDDHNSYWQVRGKTGATCVRGIMMVNSLVENNDTRCNGFWVMGQKGEHITEIIENLTQQPIQCGQTIRLTHLATGRNLHSHHFQSPLSHNLEVSAFGEGGEGDEGDNWVLMCSNDYWSRNDNVRLKNAVTENYLHVTGDTFGRPIHGQREVSAYPSPNELNYWQTMEGIYIKPSESPPGSQPLEEDEHYQHHEHNEL